MVDVALRLCMPDQDDSLGQHSVIPGRGSPAQQIPISSNLTLWLRNTRSRQYLYSEGLAITLHCCAVYAKIEWVAPSWQRLAVLRADVPLH